MAGVTSEAVPWVPSREATDAALVQEVLNGEGAAFTMLADRHAPSALRFATRMLGSVADAEEAVQDALLRAYRGLGDYDERRPFRTWLFSILVNRCRTAALLRARRTQRFAGEEGLHSASVAADAPSTDLREEITWAVAQLDPRQREAFLLRHVEDLTFEEMAKVTGARVGALKMRVARAAARLRELLREP